MNPSSRDQAHPARQTARLAPPPRGGLERPGRANFVVLLRERECRLSPDELSELRRWIHAWWRKDRNQYLLMGCSAESDRQCRRRRLLALREQVVECGLNPEEIRSTDDWITPPWQEPAPHMPTELVWMKAVDLSGPVPGVQPGNDLIARRGAH